MNTLTRKKIGAKNVWELEKAGRLSAYWRQTLIELNEENMHGLACLARDYSCVRGYIVRPIDQETCLLSEAWNDDAVKNQRPFVTNSLLQARGLLEKYLATLGGLYDVDGVLDDLATYGGGRWWLPAVQSDVFKQSLEERYIDI